MHKKSHRANHMKMKRKTKTYKKGGAASAADYGVYVWGTNQMANPAGGNVIQVANHPLTPAKMGGAGGAHLDLMGSMLSPTTAPFVVSQSASQTPAPVPVSGGKRRRTNKRRRMSKRKY